MKQIFISDLHLDEDRLDLTDAFHAFLEAECRDTDQLYILGDFFEVWLGDDDDSAFNQRIIAALRALPCEIFLMHGNRDFLLGDDFCRQTGASLLQDPCTIQLAGEKVLLMHGDSLCTRDTDYMKAREQLRSADFQADFLSKPLQERSAIARQIRGESRAHTQQTAMDIMDVTPDEVVRVMQEAGVKVLIHGHTHRPAVHEVSLDIETGTRYVLGDWRPGTRYLCIQDDQMELREFTRS